MEIMPNPNNLTGMSKKFEDYDKDKKYYFRTKDGKPYNGNTNYKFVGKNDKVFYTGKTFTKYSELLVEFPNGFFVTEDFHDTPFTKWLIPVQDDENPFLFPVYGQGETMTEQNAYARDVLGQNLTQFNPKTGRREIISTSINEPPPRQPPNNLDVATPATPATLATPPDEIITRPVYKGRIANFYISNNVPIINDFIIKSKSEVSTKKEVMKLTANRFKVSIASITKNIGDGVLKY